MNFEKPNEDDLITSANEQMTSTEKGLTKDREEMMEILEGMGQTGYIEFSQENGESEITGVINGSKLKLKAPGYGSSTLDKVFLPEDVAKRLFEQYRNIAIDSKKIEAFKATGKYNQEVLDKANSLLIVRV